MLDSKFFFTLVGLVIAVFAICNTNMSPAVSEGFWNGPSRTVRVMREVHPQGSTCGGYSLQNNYQAMLGNDKFYSQPNFQGLLSPRMNGGIDYGANIRYNLPSYENQGVPYDALGMADMAKEGYENTRGGGGVPSCGKGGVSLGGQVSMNAPQPISTDSDHTAAMNKIYDSDHTTHDISDGLLAVGDMTTINAAGQVDMPIVYDRYIYANRQSRLRSQGDPIRGDLGILPGSADWFQVSVSPNIDLHPGAMNVLGGPDNGTARALGELQYATSGGYQTISGGVNMANQFATTLGAGMADVNVTAFV
jgi:hypothetical protein